MEICSFHHRNNHLECGLILSHLHSFNKWMHETDSHHVRSRNSLIWEPWAPLQQHDRGDRAEWTLMVTRSSQPSSAKWAALLLKMLTIDWAISVCIFLLQSMSNSAMTNLSPLVNAAVSHAELSEGGSICPTTWQLEAAGRKWGSNQTLMENDSSGSLFSCPAVLDQYCLFSLWTVVIWLFHTCH